MKKIKWIAYALWVFVPLYSYYIVLNSIGESLIRISALSLILLLSWQLFLGSFLPRLSEKWGGWVSRYHFHQGIYLGVLLFLHPLFYVLRYPTDLFENGFNTFLGFCLLCNDAREFWISLGRIAFWLSLLAIVGAKIRHWEWWDRQWRFFHLLNYPVFALAVFHAWRLGTDIRSPLYFPLLVLSLFLVFIAIVYRLPALRQYLKQNLK